tara:strand:- start:78 stop:848 length:771 start_codon:yes stop_codon:yes gene_type:complete
MAITTDLLGGLGNYMFQIATTHSLAIDNGDVGIYDSNGVVKIHNHLDTYKTNILRNLSYGSTIINTHYSEPYFSYNKIMYKENLKVTGYFQSEKYFQHNRGSILDLFSVDSDSDIYIKGEYGNTLRNNTCSIHVRRGDYVRLSNIHPPCEMGYYLEAVKQMPVGTVFLVFSDDMDWCKQNFNFSHLIHFVDGNPDFIDMWLMSLCDNNITANSSFSWWGAWLNQNPNKKVISPSKWFGPSISHDTKDLIPETWITI